MHANMNAFVLSRDHPLKLGKGRGRSDPCSSSFLSYPFLYYYSTVSLIAAQSWSALATAHNCIKQFWWLPELNRHLTGIFWPTRFDVTIETIVLIVTSNLIGKNKPVRSRLSNQFLYTIQCRWIQLVSLQHIFVLHAKYICICRRVCCIVVGDGILKVIQWLVDRIWNISCQ